MATRPGGSARHGVAGPMNTRRAGGMGDGLEARLCESVPKGVFAVRGSLPKKLRGGGEGDRVGRQPVRVRTPVTRPCDECEGTCGV